METTAVELANGLANALVHVEVQTERHNDLLTTHHQSLMEMQQPAKALNSTQENMQSQTQALAQNKMRISPKLPKKDQCAIKNYINPR